MRSHLFPRSVMRLRQPRQFRRQCQSVAASSLAIALLTFTGFKLHFNNATIVLLLLFVVVLQSLTGRVIASVAVALAAAGCLDYFFLPPILSFRVDDPMDGLALSVFVVVALVVACQVSRVRVEALRARRHSLEVERVYDVALRLLLLTPDQAGGVAALKVFRDVLGATAVCLFDASTIDLVVAGSSQHDLAARTRQAYIFGKDTDDPACGVFVRCLKVRNATSGAIGFEGLRFPEMISPALPVLAAAALERAQTFRLATHETAAAQAEAFRTAILDALAHEFKTPLATILAVMGGILESRTLEPEQQEMAGMIESEVTRLSGLTTRLLRTARLDSEEVKPRLELIDLRPFVERVVHRFMSQDRECRITVDASGTPGVVRADRQLLDLALTQLLDNALKYSPPTSAVAVNVQAGEEFITVSVRNEGNAIAPAERHRIFDRFYRGTRVRNLVSGSGLGLHVARKIAAAHGGSLNLIADGSAKGVVFDLKLPISKRSLFDQPFDQPQVDQPMFNQPMFDQIHAGK
jgi:two-component system sensor histidine kinase KdpD